MFFTVQQREEQPRREMLRNKTCNSEQRKATLTDNIMRRVAADWKFRRYSGLMWKGSHGSPGTSENCRS
eukprot:3680713-Alexandrium_andersonii.AAC.1